MCQWTPMLRALQRLSRLRVLSITVPMHSEARRSSTRSPVYHLQLLYALLEQLPQSLVALEIHLVARSADTGVYDRAFRAVDWARVEGLLANVSQLDMFRVTVSAKTGEDILWLPTWRLSELMPSFRFLRGEYVVVFLAPGLMYEYLPGAEKGAIATLHQSDLTYDKLAGLFDYISYVCYTL